jgi:peroxiredoxin
MRSISQEPCEVVEAMIEEGKPAPDFTLSDQNGQSVSLSGLKGSPIVLYFYPKEVSIGRRSVKKALRNS